MYQFYSHDGDLFVFDGVVVEYFSLNRNYAERLHVALLAEASYEEKNLNRVLVQFKYHKGPAVKAWINDRDEQNRAREFVAAVEAAMMAHGG